MRVLCFGDSITHGYRDRERGGWVERLRQEKERKTDEPKWYSFYNLGIAGDTSRDLLERFEEESLTRRSDDGTVILIQIGINDSQLLLRQEKNQVSVQEFRQNLEKLRLKARELADELYFLGMTPVVEEEVNPREPNTDYRFKDVREYEDELHSFCREKDVKFIEIFDHFIDREDYRTLLADGLHPNEKGHEMIKEKVKERLEKDRLI